MLWPTHQIWVLWKYGDISNSPSIPYYGQLIKFGYFGSMVTFPISHRFHVMANSPNLGIMEVWRHFQLAIDSILWPAHQIWVLWKYGDISNKPSIPYYGQLTKFGYYGSMVTFPISHRVHIMASSPNLSIMEVW